MKNLYIASDHAGYELKKHIIDFLKKQPLPNQVVDLGTHNLDSVDYPDYADLLCQKLENSPSSFGILICGSGQGMCMRANKYSYIRASLVYNDEIAKLSREHNNSNVICLGSRFCTAANAEKWISIFLNTPFSEGRHSQRVDKLSRST